MAERPPRLVGGIRSLWRFRSYGRPHLSRLLVGLGFRMGELLADLAQPWPLAVVADNVVRGRPLRGVVGDSVARLATSRTGVLAVAALASFTLLALSAAFDYLGDRIMNGAGERVTATIRRDLFARTLRLPLAWHDRQAVGELTSRLIVDTDRIEDGLVDVFSTLVPGLITVTGFGVVLLLVEWRLGLVALAATPIVYGAARGLSRKNRLAAAARRDVEGKLATAATETLQGIRTVHTHAGYSVHDEEFGARSDEVLRAGLRSVDLRARLTPLLELAAGAGSTAVLWFGGYGVVRGWWTLGLLLVVLAYVRNMTKPMRALSQMSLTLSRAAASADRVHQVFEVPSTPRRRPMALRGAPPRHGRITFDHVTLDYGRGPVLDGVSLVIAPGRRVALVGENGAGKSSMLALIAGIYQPVQGRVLVDGNDVGAVAPEHLARHVAVVPQDTFLFAGTVAQNIRYARPDADPELVLQAARAALVDQFVRELPAGYDTVLGDRGVGLSGGQRQRIGIARALLTDAPVVLLDEPTSGLDAAAEAEVVTALAELMRGRTVVMTTHRPALLALADTVLEVRDGTVHPRPTPPRSELSQRRAAG